MKTLIAVCIALTLAACGGNDNTPTTPTTPPTTSIKDPCPGQTKCGTSCMPIGSVCCDQAGTYCGFGEKCAILNNGCLPKDNIDCRNGINCTPDLKCGSNRTCIPIRSVDCGNGTSCSAGNQCANDVGKCLPDWYDYCGAGYYCSVGVCCGTKCC